MIRVAFTQNTNWSHFLDIKTAILKWMELVFPEKISKKIVSSKHNFFQSMNTDPALFRYILVVKIPL